MQCSQAVEFMHEQSMMHCDLKEPPFLFSSANTLRLVASLKGDQKEVAWSTSFKHVSCFTQIGLGPNFNPAVLWYLSFFVWWVYR